MVAEHGCAADGAGRDHARLGMRAGPDRAGHAQPGPDRARCRQFGPDRADPPDRTPLAQPLAATRRTQPVARTRSARAGRHPRQILDPVAADAAATRATRPRSGGRAEPEQPLYPQPGRRSRSTGDRRRRGEPGQPGPCLGGLSQRRASQRADRLDDRGHADRRAGGRSRAPVPPCARPGAAGGDDQRPRQHPPVLAGRRRYRRDRPAHDRPAAARHRANDGGDRGGQRGWPHPARRPARRDRPDVARDRSVSRIGRRTRAARSRKRPAADGGGRARPPDRVRAPHHRGCRGRTQSLCGVRSTARPTSRRPRPSS